MLLQELFEKRAPVPHCKTCWGNSDYNYQTNKRTPDHFIVRGTEGGGKSNFKKSEVIYAQ